MAMQPEVVRAELARILAFEGITNSAMLGAFLRYIVEETLAGRGDRLKAYTIAVEALKRPEDFDPNDNPLVRVQARRLRDVLLRFYSDPDNLGDIRIDLPVGKYVPEFVSVAAQANKRTGRPEFPFGIVKRVLFGLLMVTVLGAAGFAGWYYWTTFTLKAHRDRLAMIAADYPPGTGLDAAHVLPQIFFTVDAGEAYDWFDADDYRRRDEIFAQLFDDMVVVRSREDARRFAGWQPTYELRYHFDRMSGALRGVMQLIRADDGRLIKAEDILLTNGMTQPYEPGSRFTTPDDLAVLRRAVQVYGWLYGDVSRSSSVTNPLACLYKGYGYYLESTVAYHLAARNCLESTIRDHPWLSPAFTLLGGMYLSEFRRGVNRLPGDPLERSEAALRKAIQIAPMSSAPFANMQSLLLARGNILAAQEAGVHAVELNPEDMDGVGSYGSLLARVGNYKEAVASLARAEANIATAPKWLHYYMFLALNNLGRTEAADRQARWLSDSSSSLYMTAAAIAAHRRGDAEAAKAAINAMIAADPEFATEPRAPLKRRGFTDAVADRLLKDLVAAGLPAVSIER